MPYLSRRDIEGIARRVITAYKKLPTLRGQPVNMIQPELLVHDLLGLSTGYHVLSPDGRVLGLTACDTVGVRIYDDPEHSELYYLDGNTVLIDKGLIAPEANKGRYHFTLIHEACHQIYKMLFPREYLSDVSRRQVHYCTEARSAPGDYWEEWRTNALASAVLMPADMIRANMLAFGLGDKLRMLNKIFAPEQYNRFSEMAEHMGVSKQAMAIRMKQLGLLAADYLQDPYALVNIYPDDKEIQRLRGGV